MHVSLPASCHFLKLSHFLSIGDSEIAQRWVGGLFKLSEKIIRAPQGGSVSVESPQNYLWLDLFFKTPVQSLPYLQLHILLRFIFVDCAIHSNGEP